jgi:hypothetical protein
MKVWTKALVILAIGLPLALGVSLAAHAKILTTSAFAANPDNYEVNKRCPENAENVHLEVNEQPDNDTDQHIGMNEQSENAENEQLEVNEQYPENNIRENLVETGENQWWNWENQVKNWENQWPNIENICGNQWGNWGNRDETGENQLQNLENIRENRGENGRDICGNRRRD